MIHEAMGMAYDRTYVKPLAPYMTKAEISAVERLFLSCSKPTVRVLEWGAGGSTIYFPEKLRQAGKRVRWTSIEHDAAWHAAVSARAAGVDVVLLDKDSDEYVGFPGTLGEQFDFVLVDGRRRRRCLLAAARLLAPGGVAVLHDAQRTYYHSAFASFTQQERPLPRLFFGRI